MEFSNIAPAFQSMLLESPGGVEAVTAIFRELVKIFQRPALSEDEILIFYQFSDRTILEACRRLPGLLEAIRETPALYPSGQGATLQQALAVCHISIWFQTELGQQRQTLQHYIHQLLPQLYAVIEQLTPGLEFPETPLPL